jgi:mannose-1-phosphate guanylyltransferase
MLQQTVNRLLPLFPASRLWIVTNDEQAAAVRRQSPKIPSGHVLSEPVGRNTAAAIGLAAIHLLRKGGRGAADAVMAVLPADHFISHPRTYRRLVRAALNAADQDGALVVLGMPPTRAETGYGYIELARKIARARNQRALAVRRFTEKPSLARAKQYVASGRYLWNAGMFFWRVSTFLSGLERHLPKTHAALMRLAETIGTSRYKAALHRAYPQLENISIDYALLEPASRDPRHNQVLVIPAAVGWSDIGSWAAVYELMARAPGENVTAGGTVTIDAAGNFLWSPGKLIAALGVRDLIVVETPDALLICPRERAQDVGKVVKWLEAHKKHALL